MNCGIKKTVHTIGHSTRGMEDFTAILKTNTVTLVVDVPRWPASCRYSHLCREEFVEFLSNQSIDYCWREDLGGFRKPSGDSQNMAWKVAAFRAYADFMLTPEFETIMREMEQLAASKRIAIMCAEAVPWRCHRQLLADAFLVRGFSVRHIMDNGCYEDKLPKFAIPKGIQITFTV